MRFLYFVFALCFLMLAASCSRNAIENPGEAPELNDSREKFYNDVILKDYQITHLSSNFASFLTDMPRDDLEDCAVLFEWIIFKNEVLPIKKAQVLNVFGVGYIQAADKKQLADQTDVGKVIYGATKVTPSLESANCDEGPFAINGRYLTMDKLLCDQVDLTGQTRKELEDEYWALSDFCYDVGWHYVEFGNLENKSLKFEP